MLSKSGAPPQVVLITSALPDEGKSTLAKSLSVLLAKQGRKVLLVEADLRRPRMQNDFGFSGQAGLSNLLASRDDGQSGLGSAFELDDLSNLVVLPRRRHTARSSGAYRFSENAHVGGFMARTNSTWSCWMVHPYWRSLMQFPLRGWPIPPSWLRDAA